MVVMMTLTEMYVSLTVVQHSLQNMTMMVGVVKKCRRHNDLAVTVNDAAPWIFRFPPFSVTPP